MTYIAQNHTIKRFIPIINNPEFPNDGETCWYWDMERPSGLNYVTVRVFCNKDPNLFVPIAGPMRLLYTDQAEYYAVCEPCHLAFAHMQWSGFTHQANWREISARYLENHKEHKGWCEFCDPIFGNGGWIPER